jgi:hypothetical protein
MRDSSLLDVARHPSATSHTRLWKIVPHGSRQLNARAAPRKTAQGQEHQQIQNRLDRMNIDELDGKVNEDLWKQKSDQWCHYQERMCSCIRQHEKANDSYSEAGLAGLELV